MTVETHKPSSALITVTEAAIRYLEKSIGAVPDSMIRISTKESGCTGYAYVLEQVDAPLAGDEVIVISPALSVAVARDSIEMLRYTEIDFVQEGINGVIKYNNPNVVNQCGCGESFNIG